MTANSVLLTLDGDCEDALRRVEHRLSEAGLRPLRTFDLHDARLASGDCSCPHHGTAACDCQMVILLIYGPDSNPATLLLHSNDGRTWLSMVDGPPQVAQAGLRLRIERAVEGIAPEEGL